VPEADLVVRTDRRALNQIILIWPTTRSSSPNEAASISSSAKARRMSGQSPKSVSKIAGSASGPRISPNYSTPFRRPMFPSDAGAKHRPGSAFKPETGGAAGGQITFRSEFGKAVLHPAPAGELIMPARILIIEDNQANLDLMSYLLRAFGHTLLTAADGEAAWNRHAVKGRI